MSLIRYLAWIVALLTSGAAIGQSTIGELLAAGGKQLTKDEVQATLSGATVSGQLANGGEAQNTWNQNGSVSGYMTNATGRRGTIMGTWKVEDDGKLCRDISIRFYESTQVKDCFPIFRLGDQIYFPNGPSSNPSTAVMKRTVTH